MANWSNFCSAYPNSTDSKGHLYLWLPNLQDFTECFHDVFQTTSHAVFFTSTLFFLSLKVSRAKPRVPANLPRRKCWILRTAAAFLILATVVTRQIILLANASLREKLGLVSHLQHAAAILAWTAVFYQSSLLARRGALNRKTRAAFSSPSRQLIQFFFWFPVFAVSVFELWSAVGGAYSQMPIVYKISIYILFGGEILILTSFLDPIFFVTVTGQTAFDETDGLISTREENQTNQNSKKNQKNQNEENEEEENEEEESRFLIATDYEKAGIFSQLAIFWAGGLIKNGRYLKSADDLFNLPKSLQFGELGFRFRKKLKRISIETKISRIFLIRVIWSMWGWRWLLIGFLDLLAVAFHFATPVFLQKLVEFFETDRVNAYGGYGWAAGLLGASVAASLLNTHCRLMNGKLSVSITGVLIDSVYRKLFSAYGADLSGPGVSGKVVNLIGSDCGRINEGLVSLHSVWMLPLEIIIALYLLYVQVGVAFLGGVGVVLLLLAGNQLMAARIVHYEEGKQTASDARIKMVQEILNCIRIIKFHAWERFFQDRVTLARDRELKYLRATNTFGAMIAAIWQCVPVGMAVTTFLIYVLMGNTLTAAKVFTSIAIFRMLTEPLMMIAWTVLGTTEMWVSLKRLQEFFQLPDLILSQLYGIIKEEEENEISFENAEFTSQTSQEVSNQETVKLLHGMCLKIKSGEFIGITGRIGSGKTVLLNSLIGELHKINGNLSITQKLLNNGFGYAPQEPWILRGTVRENILFGTEEMDFRRYQQVLDCCALTADLENLPAGDSTEIGERGVTLSGGQKARLSLARAVYQNKDVILMDDPLAAVDPHVASTIYTKCFRGVLKSKTRILVTHNVEFLRQCDFVLVMKEGKRAAVGTPSEVLSLPDLEEAVAPRMTRQSSIRSVQSGGSTAEEEEEEETLPSVEEEESATGVVKWSVYLTLFRAIGWPIVAVVVILAVISQGGINGCDVWISYWIGQSAASSNSTKNITDNQNDNFTKNIIDAKNDSYFLIVYGGIAGGAALLSIFWPFFLFFGFLKASKILHRLLLDSVLKAKMQFFDSTPSGRILNRFSKDINSSDDSLPLILLIFLAEILSVFGTLTVVIYSMPWFFAVVAPVAVVYYVIQEYYRHAARELKRLNATSLSPLYSLYGETIQGLTTIRSMRATDRFCQRFSKLLVTQQRVQFAMLAAEQWLELRLEFLGILLIAGVLLVGFVSSSQSAAVGLALSYSLSVVGALISLVDAFIRCEKGMVFVERIKQYIDDVEPEPVGGPLKTTPDWPSDGSIDFEKLSVRYRADLPDVLDNVQLRVRPGEKVGIVGRTGAGKSSLLLALFRILEPSAGSIVIDGVKIANLNLKHLRSRLTIIPQTASLFDASIRDNLDPLRQYPDERVWRAVEKCHLRSLVDKLGGDLSSQVGDNGKNLSAGEKQLVSLARALLSNSKIICLDEATANIDFETDMLVQQTIRECLVDSTILTIAHRVQTVMDCDRVVVMSNGRIVEEGHPFELMRQTDSRFFHLVQQSKTVGAVHHSP